MPLSQVQELATPTRRLDGPKAGKKVLRPAEAADYIGLAESTLAKRRVYGKPPRYVSLGGRAVGYLVEDLDEWLASCRRSSTSETEP
jgi:predicted DNA-binding transcriptional regulator AlpA